MSRFGACEPSRSIDMFYSPLKRSKLNVLGIIMPFNYDSLDLVSSKSSRDNCHVEEKKISRVPGFWKHLRLLLGCSGIP